MHRNPKMRVIKRAWTQEKPIGKENGSSGGNVTCCGMNDTSTHVTGQRVRPALRLDLEAIWNLRMTGEIAASTPEQMDGKQGWYRTGRGSQYLNEMNSERSKN